MRKVIPILLIAVALSLTVFSAGCVQRGNRTVTVSSTDGLVIKEFSTDLDRYENSEPIPLYLDVENVGGTTAKAVKLYILGASWDSTPCPGNVSCDSYNLSESMSPPDLSTQPPVPGDFKIASWTLDPYKSLPEGIELPVTVKARVVYNYSSNGEVAVPVLNKEYYKMLIKQNKEIPQVLDVKNSNGPIHIDIDKAGLPIILSDADTAQVRIYIKNVGSGAPIKGYEIGPMHIKLQLISPLNVSFNSCEVMTNTTYSAGKKTVEGDIVLRHGETVTIPCTIKIDSVPELYDSFRIIFTTDYTYYTESSTTFTIVGTPSS